MKPRLLLGLCIALCAALSMSSCVDNTDSDGDGVADRNDNCPSIAGDRETGGCPWYMVDACSGDAQFTLDRYHWTASPTFYYSTSLPTGWRDYVDYAASTWNSVGTPLQIRKYAAILSAGAGRDQRSVVSRAPLGDDALGKTYVWYDPSTGIATEADVVLNSSKPLTVGGTSSSFDVYSVLVHEFGHFCGLNHVSNRSHSMYPSIPVNSNIYRTLCVGDELGLRRLYR